jgi:hypothetical protein
MTSEFRRRIGLVVVAAALVASLVVVQVARAAGSVSLVALGAPYTENFDTLASVGTSSVVPNGWDFAETGTNANTTYTAGTGSSNTGDTYSFGASAIAERAFGALQSGSLIPTRGASFTNDTGTTLRLRLTSASSGADAGSRPIDSQHSLDATN